jgi:hypothetical protein
MYLGEIGCQCVTCCLGYGLAAGTVTFHNNGKFLSQLNYNIPNATATRKGLQTVVPWPAFSRACWNRLFQL